MNKEKSPGDESMKAIQYDFNGSGTYLYIRFHERFTSLLPDAEMRELEEDLRATVHIGSGGSMRVECCDLHHGTIDISVNKQYSAYNASNNARMIKRVAQKVYNARGE